MKDGPVIVCRSAKEEPIPGTVEGYSCEVCLEPLRLSSGALGMMKQSPQFTLLCTDCGLIHVMISEGTGREVEYRMSPIAKAQVERGNNSPLAQWLRKHTA